MSRSTTGLGLFVVPALVLLRAGLSALRSRTGWRTLLGPRFVVPAAVLAAFLAAAVLVNEGRWHDPFTFADLRRQVFQVALHPDRLTRLARYGLFNVQRLPFGILYYILPIWTERLDAMAPLGHRLHELFDAAERPAASILLTDPLWCVLAVCGTVLTVRRRVPGGAVPLVLGLCVAPVLILSAWYLAFRYRVEFTPLLFTLSCLSLPIVGRQSSIRRARHVHLLLVALCGCQIAGTTTEAFLYAEASFGPRSGYAAFSLANAFRSDGGDDGIDLAPADAHERDRPADDRLQPRH